MPFTNWQEVDKLVNQAVRDGTIHMKTLDNTPKAAIRAITFGGKENSKPSSGDAAVDRGNQEAVRPKE